HGKAVDGLKWLKAHGIDARGHVLVWPSWKNLPKEVRQMHDEGHDDQILPFISTHIREMAEVSRGLMSEWDVLNEPYTNHDLMDIFGNQIMVDWFKEARAAMPGVRLVFNDFSNHDELVDAAHVAHFERSFRYLQAEGAPVDMLGLQAHISGQPNAPARVLATLDRYQRSSGGLPVRFTEFDIRTDDEDLQADYTRDFLILAYSHPTVAGVQFWGFWEKAHWIPVGAMFRGDWSEKPAAKVYRDLVLNKWRTNVDGATGRDGSFMTRAFQGDYEITVSGNGKTATTRATLAPGNYGAGINLPLK
ncbi:MAG TPA: endo-1,4-beta-xylanase, partial [Opitutales bacterium]|nr:endo-1,4-beta-xylanase [Opitutales bacterium]